MVIAPRRVTVTSAVQVFPEPRLAWMVPTEAPFAVAKNPAWQIVGLVHAQPMVEYEMAAGQGRMAAETVYAAAEDATEHAADWPVIRWLPLNGDALEDGALHPRNVAFSFEDAEERAKRNADAAQEQAERKPRARGNRLGRRITNLTGAAEFTTEKTS
jgi:hypothetical protein